MSKEILLITFFDEPKLIFFSPQLNGSKYCYVSLLIQHQLFVCTQLNNQTVLFLTIQFSISHLFADSLNIKQFCLTRFFNVISRTLGGRSLTPL